MESAVLDAPTRRRPRARRVLIVCADIVAFAVLCASAIWLSVRVTPLQPVSVAGQGVQVGAVSPSLSLSGPGELDLFGESIATKVSFDGPIRPRLDLTHVAFGSVPRGDVGQLESQLTGQLASGWLRYCLWQALIAVGITAFVLLALAGVRRAGRNTTVALVATGVVAVTAVDGIGVYLLASGTPQALRQVRSLEDLVGQGPLPSLSTTPGGSVPRGAQAVVIGDSTAAGLGNPLVDDAGTLDRSCGRSKDAYADYLASVNGWKVQNLACSGATIRDGLLGPQTLNGATAPAQLALARTATDARVIIVSVGADDVHWAAMTELCASADACSDPATSAYFNQQLASFTLDYYALLRQLAALPQHPTVLINEYYNPFGESVSCLASNGVTPPKAAALQGRLDQLNTVLREGARASGFQAVAQHFDGHQLCTDQSFVQGPDANAPLHPTITGELAIALADQQALIPKTAAPPATPAS